MLERKTARETGMKRVSVKCQELVKECGVGSSAHLCPAPQDVQEEKDPKDTGHWGPESWVPSEPHSVAG